MVSSVLAAVAGGLAGFVYYKVVGCRSGVCPITSSPWVSTLYGAAMGFMMATGQR